MKTLFSNIEELDYREMNMIFGGDDGDPEGNDEHIIWEP